MRGVALLLVSICCGACIEPDLGLSPFLCNRGEPKCPEGYVCVGENPGQCVSESGSNADGPIRVEAGYADGGPDTLMAWPDGMIDGSVDGPVVRWDLGKPDMKKPKEAGPDGWPPHIGCQSHTECKDASNPCCCPMPLVPQIWACLPLCLNPFCI